MKKGTIRIISEKLNKSIWFRPVLILFICSCSYQLLHKRTFQSQVTMVINLFFLLGGMFLLYMQLRKKQPTECWIYCLLILAAIFNHLYDPDIFYSVFHVRILYGIMAILFYGIFRIAGHLIRNALRTTMSVVEEAAEGWAAAEEERKQAAVKAQTAAALQQ